MPEILDVATSGRELAIRRRLAAPRAAVWRCWTEPELLKQWFCPKPWHVTEAVIDLRPGGRFFTRMAGPMPDGSQADMPNEGCFLSVEPERRLVFTDALHAGWRPAAPARCGDPCWSRSSSARR